MDMTFAQNVQGPTAGFSPFTLVSDQPATFAERGVVLPLTSPALAGARMRGTAGGSCEFLLPNPSGRPAGSMSCHGKRCPAWPRPASSTRC